MVYKKFLILILLILTEVSFAQTKDYEEDTINITVILPRSKDINISGERLFPSPCVNDSVAFKIAQETGIYLIMKRRDTLYVLVDLIDKKSKFFVYNLMNIKTINDSMMINFSKIYKERDSSIFGVLQFKIFTSKRDSIVLFRQEVEGHLNDLFSITSLKVQDTLISFFRGFKIGDTKESFIHKFLGVNFTYKTNDFFIFLTDFRSSKVSWYYKYYCSQSLPEEEYYWYCQDTLNFVSPYYLIKFQNDRIFRIEVYFQ